MLIDTHCHLDFPDFDYDREDVIQRAKSNGVAYIVNIGSSLENSKKSLELSQKYDFIYASIGIHPHEADKINSQTKLDLKCLAENQKVVAIGEVGLDYYKNYSLPKNQRQLFTISLELAKDLNLPVVIHTRLAEEDTLGILKSFLPIKAVVHCFSADEDFLKECLESGFFISFTCNITYKKAENLRSLVKITPLDRLFLETDAPFLPPEGLRGKRNEPHAVRRLAEEIARIKEITFEEVAQSTTDNAIKFFNLI